MSVLKALQDLASELANEGIHGDITLELPMSGYIRLCGELSAYVRAPAEPMNGDLRIEGPLPIRVLLPREMRKEIARWRVERWNALCDAGLVNHDTGRFSKP